jgi:hypothetical protein
MPCRPCLEIEIEIEIVIVIEIETQTETPTAQPLQNRQTAVFRVCAVFINRNLHLTEHAGREGAIVQQTLFQGVKSRTSISISIAISISISFISTSTMPSQISFLYLAVKATRSHQTG